MKKLTKSRDNAVFAGVLGGFAAYFGIDATIVRIIYVVLAICSTGFPAVFLYIVLMFVMPSDSSKRQSYGHKNPYYQANKKKRKDVTNSYENTKDDWSDF